MKALDFEGFKSKDFIIFKDHLFFIWEVQQSFISGIFIETKRAGFIFAHEMKYVTKLVNHELAQALYT